MRPPLALFAAISILIAATLSLPGSAAALGRETFGCRVAPNPTVPPYTPTCRNQQYATQYVAGFSVDNVTAPSTYTWSIPTQYQSSVYGGCTSDRSDCAITMPNEDGQITVSVTITQGGSSETLSSTARFVQYCGDYPC